MVAVGEGSITPISVIKKMFSSQELFPDSSKKKKDKKSTSKKKLPQVIVEGQKNVLVNIAKCCQPTQDNRIVGYSTVGKGITVHKQTCHNIAKADPSRLISTQWSTNLSEDKEESFEVNIRITGHDRVGLLKDILTVLSNLNINITSMHTSNSAGVDKIDDLIRIQISNLSDLSRVFSKLNKVEGIDNIQRV